MKNLHKTLAEPKSEYRPIPFWSWNDLLHEKDLEWMSCISLGKEESKNG